MPKQSSTFDFPLFDRKPEAPLRPWLYAQIRSAILDGRFRPGARLPASRTLASELGIARGTVVEAFEQLAAEGYVRCSVGAGTFVSDELPDALLEAGRTRPSRRAADRTLPIPGLSQRGVEIARLSPFPGKGQRTLPLFDPYLPALDEFPLALWGRLVTRRLRTSGRQLLGDGDPKGYLPLRRNIADYVSLARGVRTTPDRILVVASVQQALDLSVRLLLDEDDPVWMEDPGYPGARTVLSRGGARIIPVPVDGNGLQVGAGRRAAGSARLAYVTPARQAPLGMGLSLSRRVELLDWAAKSGAWIFEDDYDGEFRYRGRPLAALQSIDRHDRVLYAGSFSKTLFPALRISYLVLPDRLVDPFTAARSLTTRFVPLLEQAALADFIEEGHYARHLRRMNTLYAERRAALVSAVEAVPHLFESVSGDEAGLSLIARLKPGMTEQKLVRAGRARHLYFHPLGPYVMENPQWNALIMGFAAAAPARIRKAMKELADSFSG